jgi:hypothetical protein
MPEFLPFAPTPLPVDAKEPEENLTEAQQTMYKHVLDHFSKADYKLPKGDKGELSEEEKFWLVCSADPRSITASLMHQIVS